MKNIKGEWWVAYHGVGRNNNSNKNKEITKDIVNNGFIISPNQFHNNYNNINELSKEEYYKVGKGLCLTDKISIPLQYSGIIEHLNHRYYITFMCRDCLNKVRISQLNKNYFVVDPNENCVRPYRILLKEIIDNNNKCYLF